jgi:hypothetical protein
MLYNVTAAAATCALVWQVLAMHCPAISSNEMQRAEFGLCFFCFVSVYISQGAVPAQLAVICHRHISGADAILL